MALRNCMKAATNLAQADVETVLDGFDTYNKSMDNDAAAIMAIDDALATAEQERQDYMDAIRESYPELFQDQAITETVIPIPNDPAFSVQMREAGYPSVTIDRSIFDLDAANYGFPANTETLPDTDGRLVSTHKRYMVPGSKHPELIAKKDYTPERKVLHEKIIEKILSEGIPAPEGTTPIAIMTGGGGASGKGTILRELIAQGHIPSEGVINVDADHIKTMLPEYNSILRDNDSRAAFVVHEESSDIAKIITQRAQAQRMHLIIDKTLAKEKSSLIQIERFKDAGYDVALVGVTIDIKEALIRALERYYSSGRLPPANIMVAAHIGFNKAFETYAKAVNRVLLFDNTNDGELIARGSEGKLEILNKKWYNKAQQRGKIDERQKAKVDSLRSVGDVGQDTSGTNGQGEVSQETGRSQGRRVPKSNGNQERSRPAQSVVPTATISNDLQSSNYPQTGVFQQWSPQPQSKPSQSISADHVNTLIRELKIDFPVLKDKIHFRVFATQADVWGAESLERDGRIKGGYISGTNEVIVIAENIKNGDDLLMVLRHELIGHFGFRNLFGEGKEYDRILDRIYRAKDGELKEQYQWVARNYPELLGDPATGTLPDTAAIADEMLARSAETRTEQDSNLLTWVYDQINSLLAKMGLTLGGKVSQKEMDSLVRISRARLRKKTSKGPEEYEGLSGQYYAGSSTVPSNEMDTTAVVAAIAKAGGRVVIPSSSKYDRARYKKVDYRFGVEDKTIPSVESDIPLDPTMYDSEADYHQAVKQRLQDKIDQFPDLVYEQYKNLEDSKGGKVLSGDVTKELSPDYMANRSLAGVVHAPASAYAKKLLAIKLAEEPGPGELPIVLIMGGGSGAGKTSSIEGVKEVKNVSDTAQIIIDTTFDVMADSVARIEQIRAAGKGVHVAMIYRDPIEAWENGVISRGINQEKKLNTGRTVAVDVHTRTHIGSGQTFIDAMKLYENDRAIEFSVIDNSRGKDRAKLSDTSILNKYESDYVIIEASRILEEYREQKKISEALYFGFKAKASSTPGPQTKGSDGVVEGSRSSIGGKPERKSKGKGQVRLRKATEDQETSPEFIAWAGTSNPVIDPYDISSTKFTGKGPFVMRGFHGTTHTIEEFDSSVRGNVENYFGKINYFTSDEGDAWQNYAGEGPDLTQRVDTRADRIEAEELDGMMDEEIDELFEYYGLDKETSFKEDIAKAMAKEELVGAEPGVEEVYLKTEKPFVIGGPETNWTDFSNFEGAREQAIENVASSYGITTEELNENFDEYEDEVYEEEFNVMDSRSNPLVDAIETVANRYGIDTGEIVGQLYDNGVMNDSADPTSVERMLRESEGAVFAEDPETGQFMVGQVVADIIQELGYDSIIMKDPSKRFPNMGLGSNATHIHIFDENNSNIKSATDNSGAFNPNDPRIRLRRAGQQANDAPVGNSLGMPEENLKVKFVRLFQNAFNRVQKLQDVIAESGGILRPESDVYGIEERSSGKIAWRLRQLDKNRMEPLLQIMKDNDISLAELDEYLIARHAQERNDHIASINQDMPDGGSGMTNAAAQSILDRIALDPIKQDTLNEAADIVYAVNNQNLQDLVLGGHLDQATVDEWTDRWDYYVPLKGKAGEESRPTIGQGYGVTGSNIKKAIGRGAGNQAESPTAHAFADAESTIVRTEKSKVGQALVQLIRDNPEPGLWTIGKRTYQRFTDIYGEPFEGYDSPPEGLVENIDYVRTLSSTGKTVYRLNPNYKQRDDVFGVMVDGEELLINIKDPVLAAQLKGMSSTQIGAITRFFGQINRYLAMINTALNPEFVITNFERDFQTAMVNLGGEQSVAIAAKVAKSIPGAVRGIWQSTFDTSGTSEWRDIYDEMQSEGGAIGFFGLEDIDTKVKILQEKLTNNESVLGKTKAGVLAVREVIMDANISVENAARLASYKVVRDELIGNGMSPAEARAKAAGISKNLTVNFNRKGEWAPVINSAYLFFNASIQGSARILTALKNRRVQIIVGGIAAASYGLAMYNRAAGGDDDDGIPYWDKISDYTKQTNLIFMHTDGSGEYTKVRLPYGYNVFSYSGTVLHDLMYNDKLTATHAAMSLASATLNAYNPIQGADLFDTIVPTFLKPYEQDKRNINYRGDNLKPEFPFDDYERPESQKAWKSTNPLIKEMMVKLNEVTGGDETHSGMIDISPEILKHYTSWLTGGAGMFAYRTVDTGINLLTGNEIESRNVPFLRTLGGAPGPQFDQDRFYGALEDIAAVEAMLKIKKGTPEYSEYMAEHSAEHKMALRARPYKKRIKFLRTQRDKAFADGDKEKATDLREQMRQIMMEFSLKYDQALLEQQ